MAGTADLFGQKHRAMMERMRIRERTFALQRHFNIQYDEAKELAEFIERNWKPKFYLVGGESGSAP